MSESDFNITNRMRAGPGGPQSGAADARARWLRRRVDGLRCALLTWAVVAFAAHGAETGWHFKNPDGRAPASFRATGTNAMVVSAHGAASRIGMDVLKAGGNAADAAIAVSFALAVLRPQSTGIGGGGFMLWHPAPKGETIVLDFRERAPLRAHRDMYVRDGQVIPERSLVGHRAVAVPGLVAGMSYLHEDAGTRPWDELIAPALRLAREGFTVYPELARALQRGRSVLARNPAMKRVFFDRDRTLREGERLVQSDLARTLETIADRGRAGFYAGPVADAIVEDMERNQGLIGREDFRAYRVKIHRPLRGRYRGVDVVSMPPPSSGGTHLIQMLNVLSGFDLQAFGFKSPQASHLMIEAMRQAYADRAHFLGDPAYVDVPLNVLLSDEYAAAIRARIDKEQAGDSSRTTPGPPKGGESTTHFCIVDPTGNVVSSTQTVNYRFGAGVMAEGTGVVLNNEMDDFSIQPGVPNVYGLVGGEANAIAPGKTPLSSMSPTIVFREREPWLVLGSPGGSRIITTVLQTIMNRIDYKRNLFDAVAEGRLHHQWLPDKVFVERGLYPRATLDALSRMGHHIELQERGFGDVQAIEIGADGVLVGVSDPRGAGRPCGY